MFSSTTVLNNSTDLKVQHVVSSYFNHCFFGRKIFLSFFLFLFFFFFFRAVAQCPVVQHPLTSDAVVDDVGGAHSCLTKSYMSMKYNININLTTKLLIIIILLYSK